MRKIRFAALWVALLSFGCASTRTFDIVGNCVPSRERERKGDFQCISDDGKRFYISWEDDSTRDLMCFRSADLKKKEEACRK